MVDWQAEGTAKSIAMPLLLLQAGLVGCTLQRPKPVPLSLHFLALEQRRPLCKVSPTNANTAGHHRQTVQTFKRPQRRAIEPIRSPPVPILSARKRIYQYTLARLGSTLTCDSNITIE